MVWQKAHRLVLNICRLTERFPRHELYGLTAQLRRSAVSIPANIVEGFKKTGKSDKARYLNIAEGSLEETRYFLVLAKDLGYLPHDELLVRDVMEIGKLLASYKAKVQESC